MYRWCDILFLIGHTSSADRTYGKIKRTISVRNSMISPANMIYIRHMKHVGDKRNLCTGLMGKHEEREGLEDLNIQGVT